MNEPPDLGAANSASLSRSISANRFFRSVNPLSPSRVRDPLFGIRVPRLLVLSIELSALEGLFLVLTQEGRPESEIPLLAAHENVVEYPSIAPE
jgi:hypothetical protein